MMEKQLIPVGYKQTEFGVIPDSWSIISIDEAIDRKIILDQMDGNHGELYPKSHEFSDFGIPYVGATDFNNGRVNFNGCKYLPEKRAKLFRKGIAKQGDVLFAHNATVGPVALLETDYEFIILSTTATYYRCNHDQINNKYLASYFSSELFVNQYSAVMSQSTRNQVSILTQRKFKLVLPPYDEQTAIANALSDVDALIAALEKLINKKSAIKTAAMQQLLTGKKRLPPFDQLNTGYKQTELGEIPGDWEVKSYGDIFSSLTTANNARSDLSEAGETAYIHYGDIHTKWHFSIDFNKAITPYIEITKIGNAAYLKEGDVIMADASEDYEGIGKSVEVKELGDKKAISGLHTFLLRDVNEVFVNGYRGYLHTIKSVKQSFDRLATGLKVYGLSKNNLKLVLVPIPPKEEQTAIANVLSDMDKDLEALQQRLHKTQQIKQGMMQELLTGKTRLV